MKKKILTIVAVVLCFASVCALLTSCQSETSLSLHVETGDNITVNLDTTNGYNMTYKDNILLVKDKDGASMLEGSFINASTYEEYKSLLGKDMVIDNGKKDTFEYILHKLSKDNDTSQQLIAKVKDTNTAIALTVYRPAKEAKELIKIISFTKAEDNKE